MAFEKGHRHATGRPKGSLNKIRTVARDSIESVLGKSIPERLMELATLNPRHEADILISLLPYCYPKLHAVDIEAQVTHSDDTKVAQLSAHILMLSAKEPGE